MLFLPLNCGIFIFNILITTEISQHKQHMLYVSFYSMISIKIRHNEAYSWNLPVQVLSPIIYIWSCHTDTLKKTRIFGRWGFINYKVYFCSDLE